MRWLLLTLLVGIKAQDWVEDDGPVIPVDLRVCTIYNLKHDALELMWTSVKHWQTLGVSVEKLNYILASNNAHHMIDSTSERLQNLGIPPENIYVQGDVFSVTQQYHWFKNCSEEAWTRRPVEDGKAPWLSWMDADELPILHSQDDFPTILGTLEGQGIHVYASIMVDRVSPDGALVPIRPNNISVFDQFPIRCSLTLDVLNAATTKAVAFDAECLDEKSGCHLTKEHRHDGAHHVDNFMGFRCQPRSHWGELAHFKWTDDVLSKLCWRTRKFALASGIANKSLLAPGSDETTFWHRESENMLNFLLQNNMKIDIDSNICSTELPGAQYVRKGGPNGDIFDIRDVYKYIGLNKWQINGVGCEKVAPAPVPTDLLPSNQTRRSFVDLHSRSLVEDDTSDDDSTPVVDEETALQNFLKVCSNDAAFITSAYRRN